MYEQRFGLHRKPFQSVLTSNDFFKSSGYEDLSSTVIHALRSDLGVAVLTGPAGIGKTVTLDSIRRTLSNDGQVMVLRGGTITTAEDLLHALHRRMLPPPGKPFTETDRAAHSTQAQRWEVIDRMKQVADFWGPTIVLLDDAHLANAGLFAELRALMEEQSEGKRLLRLMIAGPLSLEEFLAAPPLTDFSQRIRTHRFLETLTSSESVAYLDHQMTRVGGSTGRIFEPEALERIVSAADGVPRCIDLLTDESLMAAYRAKQQRVSSVAVDEGLSRLRHLPYSWNVSLYGTDDEEVDDVDNSLEIGETQNPSSAATQVVSHGVIEVGGPAASTPPAITDCAAKHDRGIVEIGAGVAATAETPDPEEPSEGPQSATAAPVTADPDEPVEATSTAGATPDFDRLFGAVAIAGGAVAVTSNVVSQGVEETEPQETHSTELNGEGEVSLEHHMVLAPKHVEATAESERTTGSESGDLQAISQYEPWCPAGSWETSAVSPRTTFHSPTDTDSSPVFDRYTWCELGRSVSPEPVKRSPINSYAVEVAEWPPSTSGLAPQEDIPIEMLDCEYGYLLSEIDSLVNSTNEVTAFTSGVPTDKRSVEISDERSDESIVPDSDPAHSLSELESLLELSDSSAEVEAPDLVAVQDEEQRSCDSREEDRGAVATPTDDIRNPGASKLFTLPIDLADVHFNVPAEQSTSDGDPGTRNPGSLEGSTQQDEALAANASTLAMESAGVQSELAESATEDAEEGESGLETVYAPRLLAAARAQRTVAVRSGLRLAAGAESYSNLPDTPLRLSESSEDTLPAEDSGTFASLFTRLRQLRGR